MGVGQLGDRVVISAPAQESVAVFDANTGEGLRLCCSKGADLEDRDAIRGPCRLRVVPPDLTLVVAEFGNKWVRVVNLDTDETQACLKVEGPGGPFAVDVLLSDPSWLAVGCRNCGEGEDPAGGSVVTFYKGEQVGPALPLPGDVLDLVWLAQGCLLCLERKSGGVLTLLRLDAPAGQQVHRVAVPDPAERKDGEDHGRDYASIALLEPVPGAAAAAALTCLVAVADYGRREVVAVRLAVGPATATVEFVHPVPARPLGLSSSSSSPAGVWVLDAEGVVTELSLAPPSAASPAHPPAP